MDNSIGTTNEAVTLTVIVQDEKSQPTANAHVSIKPSDASGVTNSVGEIQFKLGSATKYEITATYGSNTVTVPYYITKGGATRLVVNPVYVRTIEKQLNKSQFFSWHTASIVGIGLGIVVLLLVVWALIVRFFRARNRKQKKNI
jgi:hypothetical protein